MIDPLHGRKQSTSSSLPAWLPARADALTRTGDSVFAFTIFATIDLVACGILAGFVSALTEGFVPFLTGLALLVAVQKPLVDRVAWRFLGSSGPSIAWAWFAALSGLFAMGAMVALHDPIVCSHFRCGTGDIAFMLAAPIAVLVVGSVATLVLRALVRADRPSARRALSFALPALFVFVAIVDVTQLVRTAFVPDAQGYFDRMEQIALFPPVPSHPITGLDRTDPEPTRTFVDRQGGLEVTRVCGSNSRACDVNVRFGPDISLPSEAVEGFHWVGADESIRVLRDPQRPVLVFAREDRTTRRVSYGDVHPARGYFAGAYDTARRDWITISAASISNRIAAPHGWMGGALLGLVVASWFVFTMRRARARSEAELARFREGHLGADGTLTFDDGTAPTKITEAGDFGPVVVLGGGDPDSAHYRDDGKRAPTFLAFGSRQHLRAAANHVSRGRAMYAFAVLLLASAPILAFSYVQLR